MELNVWTIVSGILVVAGLVFSSQFAKIKSKVGDALLLVKEATDLVTYILDASKDNKLDSDEILIIKKEAAEVKAAWLKLLGR